MVGVGLFPNNNSRRFKVHNFTTELVGEVWKQK